VTLNIGPSGSLTDLIINSANTRAYVTYNQRLENGIPVAEERVAVVDIQSGSPTYHEEIDLIQTDGDGLTSLAFQGNEEQLYVASAYTDHLLVIDPALGQQTDSIPVGDAPHEVILGPYAKTLFVAGPDFIQFVDFRTKVYLPLMLSSFGS
jgi:YVTN family beta-propeller protein